MIRTYTFNNVTWLDVESPTPAEVAQISETWNINPLVAQELSLPSTRQKVDLYREYLYLVLHFPAIRHSHSRELAQEIDFIIGKKFIITTHYDTIDPLHQFSKVFEVNSVLDRGDMGENAGYVFYYMMKTIYKALADELESLKSDIARVERRIFSEDDAMLVERISGLSRDLIALRRTTLPHREMLDSLTAAARHFFGADMEHRFRDIVNEYRRIETDLNLYNELIIDLRETNATLVSTRQNALMKKLTVTALIALPLTIITALMQIDSVSRPLIGQPGDFYALIVIEALIGIFLYEYSKKKKWL